MSKDMFNIPNPNLLSSSDILNDIGSDPVFPKVRETPEKPLVDIRLPYRSIFDQKQEKKKLFDEPSRIRTQNPNLITYQEMDYLVEGESQEDKGADILTANNALKSGNYILAEETLGRKLTPSEIARQRVSDETVYTLPSSEPLYKTYENLNLMFDVSDSEEERKLKDLTDELSRQGVTYSLKSLDDKTVLLASQKRISKMYFPKPVTSSSREEEDSELPPLESSRKGTLVYTPETPQKLGLRGSTILEKLGLRQSNFLTIIRQSNSEDLIKYASVLGLDFSGKKGTVGLFRKDLIKRIESEQSREMPDIIEEKTPTFVKEESVQYGSGLPRVTRKKKAPKTVFNTVGTLLIRKHYKRKY